MRGKAGKAVLTLRIIAINSPSAAASALEKAVRCTNILRPKSNSMTRLKTASV